jgi:hypothetical protein
LTKNSLLAAWFSHDRIIAHDRPMRRRGGMRLDLTSERAIAPVMCKRGLQLDSVLDVRHFKTLSTPPNIPDEDRDDGALALGSRKFMLKHLGLRL